MYFEKIQILIDNIPKNHIIAVFGLDHLLPKKIPKISKGLLVQDLVNPVTNVVSVSLNFLNFVSKHAKDEVDDQAGRLVHTQCVRNLKNFKKLLLTYKLEILT